MSTLNVGTIQNVNTLSLNTLNASGQVSVNGNLLMNSGYGSAAVSYGCRAWATFNGNNGAISASGNVSSITRTNTGRYTLNFSTAMPDSNYAFTGTTTDSGGGFFINLAGSTSSSTQRSFSIVRVSPLNNVDSTVTCVAVFR